MSPEVDFAIYKLNLCSNCQWFKCRWNINYLVFISYNFGNQLVGSLSNGIYYASQIITCRERINRLGVTFSLTILNSTITQTGITMTSAQSGVNYAWINCYNGNKSISGLKGQSFIRTLNGSYALEISLNNCSATSTFFRLTL